MLIGVQIKTSSIVKQVWETLHQKTLKQLFISFLELYASMHCESPNLSYCMRSLLGKCSSTGYKNKFLIFIFKALLIATFQYPPTPHPLLVKFNYLQFSEGLLAALFSLSPFKWHLFQKTFPSLYRQSQGLLP